MITPLFASMAATNLTHNAAATMFGTAQAQMALANSVTGRETPARIQQLANVDKALMFEGIRARTMYFAGQMMQLQAQKMKEDNQKLKERLMAAGATFV